MHKFSLNTKSLKGDKKYSVLQFLQLTFLVAAFLYFGKSLFIPLSFSFLISCILYPFCVWLEKKGVPRSLAIAIALFLLIFIVFASLFGLLYQLKSFASEWNSLKIKLIETYTQFGNYINSEFNITIIQQEIWLKNIADNSGSNVIPMLSATAYSVSVYLVLVVIIPVMSALILYYRHLFLEALYTLFEIDKKETIRKILHETIITYYNFIKGMAIVYLIVGVLNSIGLAIIGIPHPILFGFLASVFTFIPYVGIMIASLLPITIAWITYNSIWYPVGVISVFAIVQYLEANIIFPFIVSNRLNINTFATIIAILAGGILWGGAGMILFVPFIAIFKLIADKTDKLVIFSVLLGTGKARQT